MNSVAIWKNKILLTWDGQAPVGISPGVKLANMDELVHFWPHVKGHAKWSKKMGCFTMEFGKQNLKRIHAQFGKIPVTGGMDKINELKKSQVDYFNMVKMAEKIKDLPFNQLPKYDYKAPPLAEYQHRGVVYLCNIRSAPLFADCGTGKTYCIINSIKRHIDLGVVSPGKTLVVAKLSTLETGWLEDTAKFSDLKVVPIWTSSSYKRKQKLLDLLYTPADYYVINHDGLRVLEEDLKRVNFQKVVVDESTIMKGFHGMFKGIKGGQFVRSLINISHHAKWRVIMSGTPAPNGPHDLWGQFAFLDSYGLALEPSYKDFMEEYYEVIDLRPAKNRYRTHEDGTKTFIPIGPKTPRKQIPKPDTIKRVGDIIRPLAFRVRIRDHLKDLPESTIIVRKIAMSPQQTKHYKDMEKNFKVVIDDERITVSMRLTQLLKLRQITSGFIIDDDGEAHAMRNNPKLAECDSLINEELPHDEKVIIWAQYHWEIKMLEKRYKKYGAVAIFGGHEKGNASKINLENIKSFINDPTKRIAIAHPRSCGHGVTYTVAHYMIFYSYDHSYENDYQCRCRIERASQKFPMFMYYLSCMDSIDEPMYQVLRTKEKNQDAMIDDKPVEFVNEDRLLLKLYSERLKTKGR